MVAKTEADKARKMGWTPFLIRRLISVLFLIQILAIIVILALSSKLWKIPKSLVPEKDDDDKGSRKRAASDTDTEDKPKFYSELEIAGDGIKVIFCLWTPYALVFGLTGLSYGRQVLDSFVGLCALILIDVGFTLALFICFVAEPFATYGAQRCIHVLMPHLWILACAITPLSFAHILLESYAWYFTSDEDTPPPTPTCPLAPSSANVSTLVSTPAVSALASTPAPAQPATAQP